MFGKGEKSPLFLSFINQTFGQILNYCIQIVLQIMLHQPTQCPHAEEGMPHNYAIDMYKLAVKSLVHLDNEIAEKETRNNNRRSRTEKGKM